MILIKKTLVAINPFSYFPFNFFQRKHIHQYKQENIVELYDTQTLFGFKMTHCSFLSFSKIALMMLFILYIKLYIQDLFLHPEWQLISVT